ncbi:AEC family transporter [Phormidium sp. FACHB-592]|uniref:AEC family transporter n=1 Tax=Stenomitos frigidus AS-A4 TaxID=2933935 RepID=A0ABV0KH02_9CYAN|nr:AEC family transporter [Phormidium sp. FACHB-592]MBD2073810.1 AEC family transporter [Phormidium sp. FACHB-592]
MTVDNLLTIYVPLLGWTLVGWVCGRLLPPTVPALLGKFLFWVGVPISIFAFLRHAQLTAALWLAPVVAWAAILLGAGLAWWLGQRSQHYARFCDRPFSHQTQGSFLLASMLGNTGYIGYPVALALVGPQYFAWTLFYDLLGSTLGSYGLGVAIAAHFGSKTTDATQPSSKKHWRPWQAVATIIKNPALWSFGLGLAYRDAPMPPLLENSLRGVAWFVVALSLVLMGMRLSQLSSFKHVKPALLSVGIKMLLVPLLLGMVLWALGLSGLVYRTIVLQMAMPPAFATLVLAEAYELDQELTVTALVVGCLGLVLLLPFWLWLCSGNP